MKRARLLSWLSAMVVGAVVLGCSFLPTDLWAAMLQAVAPVSTQNAVPRDAFGFGVFLLGAGMLLLGATKAWVTIKSGPEQVIHREGGNGTVSMAMINLTEKMQKLMDQQGLLLDNMSKQSEATRMVAKTIHDDTVILVKELAELMERHDAYVREHVQERGVLIARALGEDLAPLIVNAVRTAFDNYESRRQTEIMPKVGG